ncbi:MAG: tRNA (uridine(34)/cytosine(34)/5-carboxymethylaminomethyluridine(34)-2'-O)-methyltransferase TrmL [Planctomycetaceae bacterium]|nr:tRNA (uridine(34)/cytosine(34)/5-carboxymethylaminomethyluridine(34)-2'-O)-methyltransferase TrmL [Planctomycetaceae bacterium]
MSTSKLNIVLYTPEIPPNTGNIGRSCVALGAKLWLIEPIGFDLGEKAIRRSGMDYWKHLDLEVVPNWERLLERIPHFNPWLFTKYAEQSHTAVNYREGDTLIFGSESSGLPDFIHQAYPERQLRIPMTAEVRSINLATAVGIAMYEFNRQVPLVTI